MIHYLLKSGILLLVFYAVYKLWLENEKMFRFNRAYLLLSLAFSFTIPLQLISFQLAISDTIKYVQLDELVINKSKDSLKSIIENLNLSKIIFTVYALIVLILTVRFLRNLYSFYRKIKGNEIRIISGEKIVLIEEPILPHSFWSFIFISKNKFENDKIPLELIAHEKAHLNQKHTLDILIIEILQIVFWFNPILIFYKKAIKLNHEFLADEAVNDQFEEVLNYQKLLLEIASNKANVVLASNINYLITKKRFIMMNKEVSPVKIALKMFSVAVIFSAVLLVFSAKRIAQSNVGNPILKEGLTVAYDTTDVKQPVFPGGIVEFYKFVGRNFKMPSEASKNKIEGKVNMNFMVEKDGSLSEITIEKDLGYGLGDEALRVLKLSPKWVPASENGNPVRVLYSLPITIQAEK